MIGQRLLHYEVTEKLGEGGMGVVYKARDTHLDRFVAVKILPPGKAADPQRRARFVQEAKSASALNHPNIVTVHDIDQSGGTDFIVMEYLPGKTLDQMIPRRGLRLNETLRIAVQVAGALARAHSAGIVHRDLKPANVIVDPHGHAKVLDFGLAKLSEPATADTQAPTRTMRANTEEGAVLGTVAYMSPEQAEGRPVDARSDIFSFGSLLYEMVTGQRAFQSSSSMSTLAAILQKEPPPIPPDVPRDLQQIIGRCLRKDMSRRYQHMDDVRIALEDLKEESDSGRLSAPAPALRKSRRRAVLAAAALAALLAGIGAWFAMKWTGGPGRPPAPVATPLTAFPGHETSASFSPDGRQVAFQWSGEAQDNLDIYVKQVGVEKPLRLTSDPRAEVYPRWSPDGRWIAFLRWEINRPVELVITPPIGGSERKVDESAQPASTPQAPLAGPHHCWTPDGRSLIGARAGEGKPGLWLQPVAGGEAVRLTEAPAGAADISPSVSPDGRRLVFCRLYTWGNGRLMLQELANGYRPRGEPSALVSRPGHHVQPAWTADSREIIFASWGSGGAGAFVLYRIPAAGGEPAPLPYAVYDASSPAISLQGDRLAFSVHSRDVNIWRVELGADGKPASPPRKWIASTREDDGPAYSPDGRRIAFVSDRSGAREIWVCSADGSGAAQLTAFGGPPTHGSAWSPDGRWLAFNSSATGDGDVSLISADGGQPRRVTFDPGPDRVLGWSRDGRHLYVQSGGETSRAGRKIDVASGKPSPWPASLLPCGESPDGRFVFYSKSHSGEQLRLYRAPLRDGHPGKPEVELPFTVYRSHAQMDDGVYFFSPREADGTYPLRFYEFSTGRTTTLLSIPRPVGWRLSVAPDRRSILYSQTDEDGTDLMLVENFR